MANKYTYALGKRKTSSAQVRLYKGDKKSTVNGRELNTYFSRDDLFDVIFTPLKLTGNKDNFYFEAKVHGGGISSQAQAIAHSLSRALLIENPDLRILLKQHSMLTRDARKVERKKPGKKKARKSPSWSKR